MTVIKLEKLAKKVSRKLQELKDEKLLGIAKKIIQKHIKALQVLKDMQNEQDKSSLS